MPSYTPWKRSKKFGDIHGGRLRLKLSDNIFARLHSITRPNPDDTLPILIEDNPSKDFFFPLNGQETLKALSELPETDYEGITHIWLRRLKKSDYIKQSQPFATYTCGSGVRLVTLYPWPNDLTINYGKERPDNSVINEVKRYGGEMKLSGKNWISKWTLEAVQRFYVQGILYHEIGHHIDWYNRHWSKANNKQTEDYADRYAMAKTATATLFLNKLSGKDT
ncbi:hypothetical protein [Kordiimonas sp. SCSIO 12610]|uniref:hypothetical protein n=1 Tax=Kordiimonas sp. SCSIO 12610 TaxID=2829597 RepID=UPI00210A8203|nr:hypothetical protein [Kordiimonas sp. SCSIO 12610]UTW56034.1 hypothetical protein KFF44_03830 [Kordiimonas sp. SCSIO 12610]